MKKTFCSLICLLLVLALLTSCGKDKENVITTISADDMTNATVILFKDGDGNVLFYNSDIERVYARESTELGYYIELEMTEGGTQKLADATKSLVGKSIQMYLGGVPIVSAQVVDEITSGSLVLSRHSTKEELLLMFDRLT